MDLSSHEVPAHQLKARDAVSLSNTLLFIYPDSFANLKEHLFSGIISSACAEEKLRRTYESRQWLRVVPHTAERKWCRHLMVANT
jgi:hypothetical protein